MTDLFRNIPPERWLRTAVVDGCSHGEASEFFESASPVSAAILKGTWRGHSLPTGHLMDGLLEKFGWYGKRIVDENAVFPLLFGRSADTLNNLNPRFLPLKTATRLKFFGSGFGALVFRICLFGLRTNQSTAKLTHPNFRGAESAAIAYNDLPITDYLRLVSPDLVIGLMEYRYFADQFFFVLERD